jgi:hypothetical protein
MITGAARLMAAGDTVKSQAQQQRGGAETRSLSGERCGMLGI